MDNQLLAGKVALITGASYGMGQAIAELFAEEGAAVVMTARGREKLDAAVNAIKAKGHKALGITADAGSLEDTKRVFETAMREFGDLDILVNNAGLGDMIMIDETTDEGVAAIMDVNFGGPLRYIREALRVFLPKNDGCIINITSVGGTRPVFGAAYAASKGALNTLTKNVAIRLCNSNIRCNAVAPGATLTPMHYANLDAKLPGADKWLEYGGNYCNWQLSETEPIDQAYACLYLASKMGRRVKGQVIQVCNGAFL